MPNDQVDNYFNSEIDKFNQHADDWWLLEGSLKTLHHINPQRLEFIERYITLAGKKILDIGCGGGILSEAMAKKGAKVVGIDINKTAIEVAKQHQQGLYIDYQVITAESLADQQPNAYDTIVCMDMLEHVPNPASVVAACAQLVKPHGDVFFCTINRNPKSYLLAILAAEYLLKLTPKGTHDYKQLIRPSELAAWCREVNLDVKNIAGLQYLPWQKQGKLNDDVSVNYLMHAVLA